MLHGELLQAGMFQSMHGSGHKNEGGVNEGGLSAELRVWKERARRNPAGRAWGCACR